MGVRTAADEKIDRAKESVHTAIEELSTVVVGRIHGYDSFTNTYLEKLSEVFFDLLRIRTILDL